MYTHRSDRGAAQPRWSGGNSRRSKGSPPRVVRPRSRCVARCRPCCRCGCSHPTIRNFIPLLLDKIAHSPDFFRNAPLVLDVGPCRPGPAGLRRPGRAPAPAPADAGRACRTARRNGTRRPWRPALRSSVPAASRAARCAPGAVRRPPAVAAPRRGRPAAGDHRAGPRRPADRRGRRSRSSPHRSASGPSSRPRATSTSTAPCAAGPSPASKVTRPP